MASAQTAVDIINNAHRRREPDALLDLMADDAELVEYRMSDISTPHVARGKTEVAGVLEDVMSREMTHEVRDVVATDERIAYTVYCEYPDGNQVLGSYVVDLDADGRITRMTGHVSWTE
jgi:hypothetical protein